MLPGRWMIRAVLVGFIASAVACESGPEGERDYTARIGAARAAKDAVLQHQPDPVPDNLKATLLPLVYFPPDPSYNVPAALTPSADRTALQMVYSDGVIRDVRRVGTLGFMLKGQMLQLAGYVEVASSDVNSLFVPFGDLTNRTETYPAGRLLDLHRTSTGYYELDFNLAYNPSCYFSPSYSCPIPPKENQLAVEIRAGERIRPH
jgi:uncharacterized protein (DUF1684 family)